MGLQKPGKFLLMTGMSLSDQHTDTVLGADGDSASEMALACSPIVFYPQLALHLQAEIAYLIQ